MDRTAITPAEHPPTPGDVAAPFRINRRRFVAGSATVAGLAATGPLVTGCGAEGGPEDLTTVGMTINGESKTFEVDNRASLLDLLRERAGLPGTKKGCNQGACGACTIHLDGRRVNSCLTLAVMHDGAEITTIEGLAEGGRLHPLQQAFIDNDGFQCGYCTPGQIMSGAACIAEGHAGSPAEIREWMSGNICRCGAYTNIVSAIAETAARS